MSIVSLFINELADRKNKPSICELAGGLERGGPALRVTPALQGQRPEGSRGVDCTVARAARVHRPRRRRVPRVAGSSR